MQDAFEKSKALKQAFTFHEAIVSGRQDLVTKYLEKDKKLANAYSADGFTPLSLAAFFDQLELAKLLLDQGGEPGLQANNDFKVNALHSAVAKNNLELCKLFLQSNVDVNIPQAQSVTPLHAAAHHGNLAIVKLLVENGASVNVYMDNGKTPIDFAESDGHAEVSQYLHEVLQRSGKKES
jgi:uncharacterized protein